MLKLLLKIPYFLYQRHRLIKRSDAYWEQKMQGKLMEIDGRSVNPRAQALFDLQEEFSIPASKWTPALVRAGYLKSVELFDGPKPKIACVEDITIDLPERSLAGRLYRNYEGNETGACLLYFHGGGFVIGDLKSHDGLCRKIAKETGQAVLAVDYRLGPENRYPAAMDDALDCWRWLQTEGARHNIDASKVSVGGDSAGAALAVLVSAVASKGNLGHQPISAALIYPLHMTVETTQSRQLLSGENIVLTQELMDWFSSNFVSDDTLANPEHLNALSNATPGNMPPTWILTCGFDPLRDDGVLVAEEIRKLGAPVKFQEYEGLYHGFIGASALFGEVDEMVKDLSNFVIDQQKIKATKKVELAAE